MELVIMPSAMADILFWKNSGNVAVQKRISLLLDVIKQNPYEGIGQPERLKYELAGYYSRRITREHRLVYRIAGDKIYVTSCRYHYER